MKILKHPDVFLRQESKEVELPLTKEDKQLIEDMKITMYENKGIGLAAIQVGYQKRIAVIDSMRAHNTPTVLINPKIIDQSDLTLTQEEGCLSCPGESVEVPRQTRIKLEYTCEHGKKLCKTFYNMKAQIIQHELDHMNGKLCIDYEKQ